MSHAESFGEWLAAGIAAARREPVRSPAPGDRVRQRDSGRLAFVLFLSNTDETMMVVRFDGFAYNSLVPVARFGVLPPEPFRP